MPGSAIAGSYGITLFLVFEGTTYFRKELYAHGLGVNHTHDSAHSCYSSICRNNLPFVYQGIAFKSQPAMQIKKVVKGFRVNC